MSRQGPGTFRGRGGRSRQADCGNAQSGVLYVPGLSPSVDAARAWWTDSAHVSSERLKVPRSATYVQTNSVRSRALVPRR